MFFVSFFSHLFPSFCTLFFCPFVVSYYFLFLFVYFYYLFLLTPVIFFWWVTCASAYANFVIFLPRLSPSWSALLAQLVMCCLLTSGLRARFPAKDVINVAELNIVHACRLPKKDIQPWAPCVKISILVTAPSGRQNVLQSFPVVPLMAAIALWH